MNRQVEFTSRALSDLNQILDWTFDEFGPSQAEKYRALLIQRIGAIGSGEAMSRSCGALEGLKAHHHLSYAKTGQHICVLKEDEKTLIVLAILHSRSDLATHIAALGTQKGDTP